VTNVVVINNEAPHDEAAVEELAVAEEEVAAAEEEAIAAEEEAEEA